jgi:hypothetical protein
MCVWMRWDEWARPLGAGAAVHEARRARPDIDVTRVCARRCAWTWTTWTSRRRTSYWMRSKVRRQVPRRPR